MARLRIILVLIALTLSPPAWADSSPEEDRAFEAAAKSFHGEFWTRSEQEWKDFTIRFPLSSRVPEAVLYQAQSLVELKKYAGAVQLLQETMGKAGSLADEYLFWIAESHFRSGKYRAAAQAFERVTREFPESKRSLDAVLGQASSRGRLQQWDQVIDVLQDSDGTLATARESVANHLLLARGRLLLAEACLAVGDYQTAQATLEAPQLEKVDASLEWQKQHLRARTLLALGQLPEALVASSNLVSSASRTGRRNLVADAVLFQGLVYAELGQIDQSVAAYQKNLTTNAPPAAQRQTLLRLSVLLIANERLAEARAVIGQFMTLDSDPATTDLARLTLAELKLRQQLQAASAPETERSMPTNLLEQAISDLDEVIRSASDRRVRGQAYLNRGWAEWMRGNYAESSAAFEQASSLLPQSGKQATARFKWADAQFRLGDFLGARTNYQFVVDTAPLIGGATLNLIEAALYQSIRAGLNADRPDLTTDAMDCLLKDYPDGFHASASVLLTGQEWNETGDPAAARKLFEEFLEEPLQSPLASEILLAIARTYEAEGDWNGAIERYDAILASTNAVPVQARAEYFRALDTALDGNETNALAYFTNFVVVHATDALAPRAQWWIADYHWQQQDYINAELNYQLVFKNWPNPTLTTNLDYEARMMAGRAAMARLSVTDAINYFTNLTSDLKCPPDLKPKAMFAYGDALMRLPSTDTNDLAANYAEAIKVFSSIERNYPSNSHAALAQGMMGNCYLQLAVTDARAYEAASNIYQRAIENPAADVSTRSQAEVGLADVLEKQAQSEKGEGRGGLLQLALDHHLNVFYETNLRDDEQPDPFWIKKAGLEAGRLAEVLQLWSQARKIYEELLDSLPVLRPLLENKILKAEAQDKALRPE